MKSYWVDILFKPRVTMKKILQEDLHYGKKILPVFCGLALTGSILNPSASSNITLNPETLMIIALILAWPAGWCVYKVSGLMGQALASIMDKDLPRDVFEALCLWSGYISFYAILFTMGLTFSSGSDGFSLVQMAADMVMYGLSIALTIYSCVVGFFFIKDTLEFNWPKTILYGVANWCVLMIILYGFTFVAVMCLSAYNLVDVTLS